MRLNTSKLELGVKVKANTKIFQMQEYPTKSKTQMSKTDFHLASGLIMSLLIKGLGISNSVETYPPSPIPFPVAILLSPLECINLLVSFFSNLGPLQAKWLSTVKLIDDLTPYKALILLNLDSLYLALLFTIGQP